LLSTDMEFLYNQRTYIFTFYKFLINLIFMASENSLLDKRGMEVCGQIAQG